MFITQRHVIKDDKLLQREFTAPERKDAKSINHNPEKHFKKGYGLQLFGIQKDKQMEL